MIPNSLGDLEGIDKDKLNFPINDARDIDMLFPGAFDHSLDLNEVFRGSNFEPNSFISDTSILDSGTLFPPQFVDTSNPIDDAQGDFDFLNETYPNDLPVKTETTPLAPLPTPPLLPILSQQPEMVPSEAPKSKKKSRKGTQKKNTKEKARKRKQKVAENIEDPAKDVNDDSMREQKRQERLMRNRASAQLSRERKKRYMKQLESQLKDLSAANANLSSQVIRLTVENNKLKDHIRRFDLQHPFATIMSSPDSNSPHSEISELGSQSPPISPDSPLGLPLSPSSQSGSESYGPPAKRARTGQGKTPIRTGAMLLALVVSFGLFCALVGIVPDGKSGMTLSRESTYIGGLPGRSLKNFPGETQVLVDFPQLPSTPLSTSSSPPPSSSPSPTVVVIPPASDSAPLTPGAKEKLAMVSLLSLSEGRSNTEDGRALDIYSEPAVEQKAAPSIDELLAAYKKILLSSNFSLEMGASYLFCPSPVQIQSNLFPSRPSLALTNDSNTSPSIRVETKDSQRRAKRLRRAGLSDITSANKRQRTNESDMIAHTTTVSGDSPQRLNLWVPTTSLFPHWAHLLPSDQEENPRKVSGLSEINCVISSIRPVMLS